MSFKELLEVDTGFTTNEPDLLALRQAIEKAVELLVLEGADLGVWDFEDRVAGAEVLQRYRLQRDGEVSVAEIEKRDRVAATTPRANEDVKQTLSSNQAIQPARETTQDVTRRTYMTDAVGAVERVKTNTGGTMGTVQQRANLVVTSLPQHGVTGTQEQVPCHPGSTRPTADPHIVVDAAAATSANGAPTHRTCPAAALSVEASADHQLNDSPVQSATPVVTTRTRRVLKVVKSEREAELNRNAADRHKADAIARALRGKRALSALQMAQLEQPKEPEQQEG